MFVSVLTCASKLRSLKGQKRLLDSPAAEVLGHCQLPVVGAGNWTWALCQK